MSSYPSPCKEHIREYALSVGASACGFATAEPVGDEAVAQYDRWLADGCNGTMDYCSRYREVRNDPRLLLDGAHTVVSCAFSYYPHSVPALPGVAHIARYAWGMDYHWVVKSRLQGLSAYIIEHYGGECRVCVDTAPIRERYWAQKAGIGFTGMNNQLIIPGKGSYFFLGEVLWTGEVPPDEPCSLSCGDCGACAAACPGGAISSDGRCDARQCVSYLTIEHRGPLPGSCTLGGYYYGCDRCQEVCPHNAHPGGASLPEFAPDMSILALSEADFRTMSSSHFRRLTRHSAMSRISLAQMRRNIESLASLASLDSVD